jgi:regulator of protease activity HflC (stomatin/prohibitin superfamily)
MDLAITLSVLAILLVVVLVFLYLSVRVVQQYEQMVVFRLGRTNEGMVRGPGLRFLVPIVDRPYKVDVREQFIEVPSQTTITKDNAPINVDFLIYWRIVDPLKSVVNVAYFAGALQGVATTTLRAVIGDILLDDVLSKREQINEVLRTKLDEVTERWGGKITTVEIREITPPRDVQDAMNRQLSAERTRRAVITESEGSRQSAINVAEGQKQSAILQAEGDRQAAILRAEGFSQALERIYSAAHGIDEKTMTLQYLEALKALGASPSTKFVIPTEFTRLAERVGGFVDQGFSAGIDPGTAASATIPPMDDPTMATRRTPRSPSHPRAPATSSVSSSPNVVGPSSEPPWPRKSSPRTPAVLRRKGPSSSRSGVTDPE